ncbi:MAG TPA: hypothetical protein VJU59_19080 [Paraburkholderia sp.]|uniref:hypothetical protein n=1 Tax=Paraburkholderia sp. TaxID=1926495 RepID=UPI002B463C3E|nr:hypothetical protein [Paraburkholderia sp.]HKR41744.1 hypothetical protein [Paraburkholderia sp.]
MTARRTAAQNKAPGRGWACWSGFSRGDGSLHAAKNNREKNAQKNRREGRFVGRRAALFSRRAACADSLCFV